MKKWFTGSILIPTNIEQVAKKVNALDQHFVEVTKLYPGLYSVELLEVGDDFVTIKTNEGTMERTNVVISQDKESYTIEFDELYGNKLVNVNSHYSFTFHEEDGGVKLNCTITNVSTTGFLGLIYKLFSRNNIGNAMLKSYQKLFEL